MLLIKFYQLVTQIDQVMLTLILSSPSSFFIFGFFVGLNVKTLILKYDFSYINRILKLETHAIGEVVHEFCISIWLLLEGFEWPELGFIFRCFKWGLKFTALTSMP